MVADEVKQQEVPGRPVAAGHLLISQEWLVFSEPTFYSFDFVKHLNLFFLSEFSMCISAPLRIFQQHKWRGLGLWWQPVFSWTLPSGTLSHPVIHKLMCRGASSSIGTADFFQILKVRCGPLWILASGCSVVMRAREEAPRNRSQDLNQTM